MKKRRKLRLGLLLLPPKFLAPPPTMKWGEKGELIGPETTIFRAIYDMIDAVDASTTDQMVLGLLAPAS